MDYITHFTRGKGRLTTLWLFFFFIPISTITITTVTTAIKTSTTNRTDRPTTRTVLSNKTKI